MKQVQEKYCSSPVCNSLLYKHPHVVISGNWGKKRSVKNT